MIRLLTILLLTLLPACTLPVVSDVAVVGSGRLVTDGGHALIVGSIAGVVETRWKGSDLPFALPFAVDEGHVWLWDGEDSWLQPLSEPVPAWAAELLDPAELEALGLVLEG